MTTLVIQTPEDQFRLLQEGKKNFIVGRFKTAPVIGQRLILQTSSEEIDTVVTDVHNEPGMMKDYLIISFPAIEQVIAIKKPPVLQFDMPGEIDDIGMLAAH